MDHDEIIRRVRHALFAELDVLALFLTGSMGRGDGDAFSDVDFLAVVEPGSVQSLVDRWPSIRSSITTLAYDTSADFGATALFSQISTDWVRFDLVVASEETLGRRSQNIVQPLFDRRGIFERLPRHVALTEPSTQVVQQLVPEFFRVVSLVPVVLGRAD